MKKIIVFNIFIASFLLSSVVSVKAGMPVDISSALKNGNVQQLAGYFNNRVELVILDNESNCSKNEAKNQINNFFSSHIPNNFIILHEGGKAVYRYTIGTLSTSNGKFRVYFLIKSENNKDYIQQLRIESSNE